MNCNIPNRVFSGTSDMAKEPCPDSGFPRMIMDMENILHFQRMKDLDGLQYMKSCILRNSGYAIITREGHWQRNHLKRLGKTFINY